MVVAWMWVKGRNIPVGKQDKPSYHSSKHLAVYSFTRVPPFNQKSPGPKIFFNDTWSVTPQHPGHPSIYWQ